MSELLLTMLLATASPDMATAKDCTMYCNPEKSKPCGKGCIKKAFTCHKKITLSCVGPKPEQK